MEEINKTLLPTMTVVEIPEGCEARIEGNKVIIEPVESEDERIRKELIEAFEAYDIESSWNLIPVKHILAWLEKLKENPKSADSIPPDCTSDAIEWHKVSDSLPDNPREVLCKDAAGNYFIGRYYSGEGWEISNYDDEDKPHHLNPSVSKWIDFPSEKQKEQKPAEWSEEGKRKLNRIYVILGQAADEKPFGSSKRIIGDKEAVELQDFIKSLRPRSMQEWSEEDEKTINFLSRLIEFQVKDDEYCFGDGRLVSKQEAIEMLKSLRPQPHTVSIETDYRAKQSCQRKPANEQPEVDIEKKAFHDAVENISDKHRAEMSVQYSLHCKVEDGTRHAVMNWNEFQKVAQKFIDIGKAEALKDMPRWKKASGKERFRERAIVLVGDNDFFCTNYAEEGEYYLPFNILEKLPKED